MMNLKLLFSVSEGALFHLQKMFFSFAISHHFRLDDEMEKTKKTDTYILCRGENGWDGCVLQVADAPTNIKAVLCKMLAAQVLMPTRGPLLPLHIVHPFLKPGVVLQGKPLGDVNGWFETNHSVSGGVSV